MADYAAALDQGTTSSRCMIFDHGGNVVAVEQLEHEQIYPKPGWVEHDANEVWQRCRQVMDGALGKVGGGADSIAALGVTNQRETDRGVGPQHRRACPQRDRVAGHPHRQDLRGAGEGGRPGSLPSEDGSSDRDLLLGTEGPVDPRERRRGSREGRRRRAGVRKHGHVVHLESDRRHRRRRCTSPMCPTRAGRC